MNLVPTELNQRLTSAVQYAVAAERFYISGKAGFWRFVGLGLVCFGIGSAIGLVCYGYGKVARNSDNLSSLSSVFAKALSEARLVGKAEGTVKLEPHEISLAKDQTISIDPGSRLHLEHGAKIMADGEIKVQLPPIIASPTSTPPPKSRAPLLTNFTVFKHVRFDKGTVSTGWEFLTSKQRSPTSQYCYYTQDSPDAGSWDVPGLSVVLYLGVDQKLDLPKTVPKEFDAAAAFARCVWFRS